MSMFLGPIHYWLYNKIGNQERLTEAIAKEAMEHGWISDTSVFTRDLPALESAIDESNIHGWLQSRITDAEERYFALISETEDHFDEVKQIAFTFGEHNQVDADLNAEEIYKCFEDFFVNGMPCDRINEVTGRTSEQVSWQMIRDIHEGYCDNADTEPYYELRKSVMDGMLINTEYAVEMQDKFHYVIQKRS